MPLAKSAASAHQTKMAFWVSSSAKMPRMRRQAEMYWPLSPDTAALRGLALSANQSMRTGWPRFLGSTGPQPDLRVPAPPVDLAGGDRAPRDHRDAAGGDVPLLAPVGEGGAEGPVVPVDGDLPAQLVLEVGQRLVGRLPGIREPRPRRTGPRRPGSAARTPGHRPRRPALRRGSRRRPPTTKHSNTEHAQRQNTPATPVSASAWCLGRRRWAPNVPVEAHRHR